MSKRSTSKSKKQLPIQATKQMTFAIRTRGGRRQGAGRKKSLLGEPNHVARERVTARTPVHVTLKIQQRLLGVQDLRRGGEFSSLRHWEKARQRSAALARNRQKENVIIQDPFSSVQSFANPEKFFGAMAATREAKKYFAGAKHLTQEAAGELLSAPKSWLLSIGWKRAR